jgi:DNA cross-link repair 1C protein
MVFSKSEDQVPFLSPLSVEITMAKFSRLSQEYEPSPETTECIRAILVDAFRKHQNQLREAQPRTENTGICTGPACPTVNENPHLGPDGPKSRHGKASDIPLGNKITFPYSRHSSLEELRHLVDIFKPKDVWPCTVEPRAWLMTGMLSLTTAGHAALRLTSYTFLGKSVEVLFGAQCSGREHRFDRDVLAAVNFVAEKGRPDSQQTTSTWMMDDRGLVVSPVPAGKTWRHQEISGPNQAPDQQTAILNAYASCNPISAVETIAAKNIDTGICTRPRGPDTSASAKDRLAFRKRALDESEAPQPENSGAFGVENDGDDISQDSASSIGRSEAWSMAYDAMIRYVSGGANSSPIRLISTTDHHSVLDEELGQD